MMDFKIEYLPTRYRSDKPCAHDDVAYVRVAEVETLITQAEQFAKVIVEQYEKNPSRLHYIPLDTQYESAQAFLASVAAWRKGQEKKEDVL